MTYSILLVQEGIPSQTHPVTGKSGKLYGQATQNPAYGVVFAMTLEEYMQNSHDLIGNTAPAQQWIPLLVPSQAKSSIRCERCPNPAVARAGQIYYCEKDAPNDAVYLDDPNLTVGQKRGIVPPPKPEQGPHIVEPVSPGVTEKKPTDAPKEQLKTTIGTEAEEVTPDSQTQAHVAPKPEPEKPPVNPTGPQAGPEVHHAQPVTPANERSTSAVEMITNTVTQKIVDALPQIVENAIANKMKDLVPAKPAKKKKGAPRPPTEFTQLQAKAKGLGINTFGKSAAKLKAAIAKKESPQT